MFLAGALRDGVTAYEVYLEKAFEEVLRAQDRTFTDKTDERSHKWPEVCEHYEALGVELGKHEDVAEVRTLRHILTHKRGELRTAHDRAKFGTDEQGWRVGEVELDAEAVIDHLDTLGASVRLIDPVAWEASWGETRPTASSPTSAQLM